MKLLEGTRVIVWAPSPGEPGVEGLLRRLGSDVHAIESRDQLYRALLVLSPDLIIARVTPGFRAPLEYLAAERSAAHGPRMVVVVDPWNKGLYYEALQLGAFDGIGLPLDEAELARIASNAMADHSLLLSA